MFFFSPSYVSEVMNLASRVAKLQRSSSFLPMYPLDFRTIYLRIRSNYVSLERLRITLHSPFSLVSWRLVSRRFTSKPLETGEEERTTMIVTRRVEIKLKPPPKHKHPHLDIVASGSPVELYVTRAFDAKNKNRIHPTLRTVGESSETRCSRICSTIYF